MGWVGSGEDFCGLGWVQKFWVGLGFEKVTHDQLCIGMRRCGNACVYFLLLLTQLDFFLTYILLSRK